MQYSVREWSRARFFYCKSCVRRGVVVDNLPLLIYHINWSGFGYANME